MKKINEVGVDNGVCGCSLNNLDNKKPFVPSLYIQNTI
jgi:hypothetical protein